MMGDLAAGNPAATLPQVIGWFTLEYNALLILLCQYVFPSSAFAPDNEPPARFDVYGILYLFVFGSGCTPMYDPPYLFTLSLARQCSPQFHT